MSRKQVRYSLDTGIIDAIETLATAQGKKPGEVIENAIKLVLDPLPFMQNAADLVAAIKERADQTDENIQVIADAIVDGMRTNDDPN